MRPLITNTDIQTEVCNLITNGTDRIFHCLDTIKRDPDTDYTKPINNGSVNLVCRESEYAIQYTELLLKNLKELRKESKKAFARLNKR